MDIKNIFNFLKKYHILIPAVFIEIIIIAALIEALFQYRIDAFLSSVFIFYFVVFVMGYVLFSEISENSEEELKHKSELLHNYIKENYLKNNKWKKLNDKEVKEFEKMSDKYYLTELERFEKYDFRSKLYNWMSEALFIALIYLIFFYIILEIFI